MVRLKVLHTELGDDGRMQQFSWSIPLDDRTAPEVAACLHRAGYKQDAILVYPIPLRRVTLELGCVTNESACRAYDKIRCELV